GHGDLLAGVVQAHQLGLDARPLLGGEDAGAVVEEARRRRRGGERPGRQGQHQGQERQPRGGAGPHRERESRSGSWSTAAARGGKCAASCSPAMRIPSTRPSPNWPFRKRSPTAATTLSQNPWGTFWSMPVSPSTANFRSFTATKKRTPLRSRVAVR